jgi:deoxyribodipyrimidine photo-lyase
VLPVFIFDPRFLGAGRSVHGFQRASLRRARFLSECVADVRHSLRALGSDLLALVGHPEAILPLVCARFSVRCVYTFGEYAHEELRIHEAAVAALGSVDVALRTYWGGTLIHRDDLPFHVGDAMPATFTDFRKRVESGGLCVRACAPPPTSRLPPLPTQSDAPVGDSFGVLFDPARALPAFAAMGYTEAELAAAVAHPDARSAFPFPGGERAALARVREWVWERDRLRTYKETRDGLLGTEYSSKLSPWLAHVCGLNRSEQDASSFGLTCFVSASTTLLAGLHLAVIRA